MNSKSGLSLFELLVSLALLALITTGLAGSMSMAVNIWERSATTAAVSEPIVMRTRLRIWLQNATHPSKLTPFKSNFVGKPTELSFLTLSSTPFFPDIAALRVTVLVEHQRLNLRLQSVNDDGDLSEVSEYVLAEGSGAKISYFSEKTGWVTEWSDGNKLPELARIMLDESTEPSWPEFTARINHL